MNAVNLEECLGRAEVIARNVGKHIKDTCGKVKHIETKQSNIDLVTETDRNVEEIIFKSLKAIYPNHKYIGEETVSASESQKTNLTDEPTWIVDPVDGTTNFVHTLPFVAICIGLAINKEPVLGVVYFPMLEEMYTAIQGMGAKCNGKEIRVNQSLGLGDSLIAMEMGSDRSPERMDCVFKNMESVVMKCHGIRSLGSAAANICAVASGHMQAFYEFGLHCWDMCAPGAILIEAGGILRDTTGGKFDLLKRRIIAASNEAVSDALSKALVVQLDIPSE